MYKMCPRCGVVFEVKNDPVFCSEKCKRLFQESSLGYLKGGSGKGGIRGAPYSGDHSEIMRPKKERQ